MATTTRAAVIGSTGKGNYGHGLDTCFDGVEGVELVAVADDDPQGLAEAVKRLGAKQGYADYRQMLAREKPDVVAVGPRWVDQRVAMVTAAADAGCHIFCEKPLAGDLADADAMLAACAQAGVKIAVAHQFRAMPPLRRVLAELSQGKYGKLVRMRARPKDDQRGGGEELIVHGTHLMDLLVAFGGPPRWASGHIAVGERDAALEDARQATEPLGPVAGDSLSATFGFDRGVRGSFDTTANLYQEGRSPYGVLLECEQALLHIRSPGDVYVYPAAALVPEDPKLAWEKVWIEDWHFYPDHRPRPMNDWLQRGNRTLVEDLLQAIREDRPALASGQDAASALEMIQGVYASHFAGGARVPIPLAQRRHPLAG